LVSIELADVRSCVFYSIWVDLFLVDTCRRSLARHPLVCKRQRHARLVDIDANAAPLVEGAATGDVSSLTLSMLACREHAARFLASKHEGSFYAMVDRHVFGIMVVGQEKPVARDASSPGPRSVVAKATQCSFRNCPPLIPIVCCGGAGSR